MAAKPERVIYDGLAQVAHAIRRSAALYVAMNILPPDSTVEDLKYQADELAQWIGGSALSQQEEPEPRSAPLGEQWPPP